MTTSLIPVTEEMVELVAKAIAKERLKADAASQMEMLVGRKIEFSDSMDDTLDELCEKIWNGQMPGDHIQKDLYKMDAVAAIRAINLKLMMSQD